jgi:putative oxidoreductase
LGEVDKAASSIEGRSKVKLIIRKLISTSPVWSALPLRLTLGLAFIAHGSQKVFGTFGGPGLAKWMTLTKLAPSLLRPTWFWLAADALGEFIGGLLMLLGMLTRLGAFLIVSAMLTAIAHVHWPNFFLTNNGFEYPMVIIGAAVALLIAGGGRISTDLYLLKK